MSIGGLAMAFDALVKDSDMSEDEKREFVTRIGHMQSSAAHIKDAIKALGIASENEIIARELLDKVSMLMKMYMVKNSAKLFINAVEDFALINTCEGNIPYIICKLIEAEVEAGEKEVEIVSNRDGDKVVIEISSQDASNKNVTEAIRVEKMCDNLRLEFLEGAIRIVIDKVER